MELDVFVQKFAEQFDETPIDQFMADTEFKSLEEWGSLNALAIISMVDEEFSVSLKGDDIIAAGTIQELFERVKSRL